MLFNFRYVRELVFPTGHRLMWCNIIPIPLVYIHPFANIVKSMCIAKKSKYNKELVCQKQRSVIDQFSLDGILYYPSPPPLHPTPSPNNNNIAIYVAKW